jgi:hypothetical protein
VDGNDITKLFDTLSKRLLVSDVRREPPPRKRPRRLAWPRTSPFHGGNTGSNPVGDANNLNELQDPLCLLPLFR